MEELDLFETLDVICNDKVIDFVWHAIYDSGIIEDKITTDICDIVDFAIEEQNNGRSSSNDNHVGVRT